MTDHPKQNRPPMSPATVRLVHDLRNSLASVRAAANMLRHSGARPAVVAQVADGLQEQVRRMLDSINEFTGVDSAAAQGPATPSEQSRGSGIHVLIADDNADAANSLAMFLRLEGHRVVVALGGEQALQLAQADPPDVIVLDIRMPDIDGYELARAVRAQPWGATVRLIAVSGLFSQEDDERAATLGFEAQLTKPLDMDVLPQLLSAPRT